MNPLKLFGTRKRVMLHHFNDEAVIMEKTDEKQVKILEKEYKDRGQASYKVNNNYFVQPSKLLLFGKIDLNNKKDISVINRAENKIWDCLTGCHFIYTNLDYKTGVVDFDYERKAYIGCSTFNLITWLKYNLLLLGNPENVIIYKIPYSYIKENSPKILIK